MTEVPVDLFGQPMVQSSRRARGPQHVEDPVIGGPPLKCDLHQGDCLEMIPRLVAEGLVCDAIVTDPPYHLTAMTSRFGATGAKRAKTAVHQRFARGFMGQQWDAGDIAFKPETWKTIATALRPGGFMLVCGGTRTHHRAWCAVEDAGLIIQDTLSWLYGTGFPKRGDLLKPAWEPVLLAYKPGGERMLQVDECRIANNDGEPEGRWPANVCHDGSDEVIETFAEFEEHRGGGAPPGFPVGKAYDDTGLIARYFYSAKADDEDRFESSHPTIKPIALLRWLVPLVTPRGGLVLDPFAGTGTTGAAALETGRNAVLIESDPTYCSDVRRRLKFYSEGVRF